MNDISTVLWYDCNNAETFCFLTGLQLLFYRETKTLGQMNIFYKYEKILQTYLMLRFS